MKKKHLSPKTGKMEPCNPKQGGRCKFGGEGDLSEEKLKTMTVDQFSAYAGKELKRLKSKGYKQIEHIEAPDEWPEKKREQFYSRIFEAQNKIPVKTEEPTQKRHKHLLEENEKDWIKYQKTMIYEVLNGSNHSKAKNSLKTKRIESLKEKLYTDYADLKKNNPKSEGRKLYTDHYLKNPEIHIDDTVIYAGTGRKPITNDIGTSSKSAIQKESIKLFNEWADQKETELGELKNDTVHIAKASDGSNVHLTAMEHEILDHAYAAGVLSVHGSTNSKAGKSAERPLCRVIRDGWGISEENTDELRHSTDNASNTREIDYKFINNRGREINVEIKMVGKGNPENNDAAYARDSHIVLANHVSDSHKKQMENNNILYVETRSETFIDDMTNVFKKLDVPFEKKPSRENLLKLSRKDHYYSP